MPLTAHTKRAVISAAALLGAAGAHDLVVGTSILTEHSATLVAIATGVVWFASGIAAIAGGVPALIARLIRHQAESHPIQAYRTFVNSLLRPYAGAIGWVVPISQVMVALSYFSGVMVRGAAVGALLLLLNIIVFQRVTLFRDDFVLLVPLQVLILINDPRGIPEIVSAMGLTGP